MKKSLAVIGVTLLCVVVAAAQDIPANNQTNLRYTAGFDFTFGAR